MEHALPYLDERKLLKGLIKISIKIPSFSMANRVRLFIVQFYIVLFFSGLYRHGEFRTPAKANSRKIDYRQRTQTRERVNSWENSWR